MRQDRVAGAGISASRSERHGGRIHMIPGSGGLRAARPEGGDWGVGSPGVGLAGYLAWVLGNPSARGERYGRFHWNAPSPVDGTRESEHTMNHPRMTDVEGGDQGGSTRDVKAESETKTGPAVKERVFVGTGPFWGLIIGVILAAGIVILAAQNTASVTIEFLGWDFSTSLIVVILGALLIGVVLDELCGLVYRSRKRRTLRDRDRLKRLERSQSES